MGFFVARYGDNTPDGFTRSEARDLVPKSNPFLQHFFDHIVGPNFDTRLGYIVDELCEIFSVSNVQEIVHKHLRIQDVTNDVKDPIIHFYEDFLQEYDPKVRKEMGAYYTPTPVVKFIVRHVDKILREDFGIAKGLASDETFTKQVDIGQEVSVVKEGNTRATKTSVIDKTFHRVQLLDPAVGTATFLNETIKFIHEQFKGQEGRWPSFVADNLIHRLHGFELMMAPYTIAHLKLGMTLKETGVENLPDRLGVYLTNTLEEGVPRQQDLFSFGLAQAVSEESQHAAEIKSERPIMIVMGNPPYSVESANKTKYADSLIDKYRVEPGGKQKLQEKNSKMLGDDYVKFIAFAEDMISKNGDGIVAMITNNGYLDNPTFRGMRWRLATMFDKIYILDLHGNSNEKETSPDGTKDDNVFDIKQGVGIILAVKNNTKDTPLGEVYHSEVYGLRQSKFEFLRNDGVTWTKLVLDPRFLRFRPFSTTGQSEYDKGVKIDELFAVKAAGIKTSNDSVAIGFNDATLRQQVVGSELLPEYDEDAVRSILYRPFDVRSIYYDPRIVKRDRREQIKHSLKDNLALLSGRQAKNGVVSQYLVTDTISEMKTAESTTGSYHFPLFLYHDDGTRTPNFNATELSSLFRNMPYTLEDLHDYTIPASSPDTVTPEDVFDYIYTVLHSPSYREKYKEFLKIDFPRVPAPKDAIEFWDKVKLGRMLRHLHLMHSSANSGPRLPNNLADFPEARKAWENANPVSPNINAYETTYPVAGSNAVKNIAWTPNQFGDDETPKGRVYVNETQYFGNVSETAWNFYIGGYQPAQKWLKDRKGRTLSNDDLDHYQKIIKILLETDRIMKEID